MSKVKPSTCSILIYLVYILQCHQQGRPIWQSETLNHKQCTRLPFIFLSLFILLSLKPVCLKSGLHVLIISPPKGGQGCLRYPSCLESQGCHRIPIFQLLSCFSTQSSRSFSVWTCHFSGSGGRLFFQESSPTLFLFRNGFFLYGSC